MQCVQYGRTLQNITTEHKFQISIDMGLFVRKSPKPNGGSGSSSAWAVNAPNRSVNSENQQYRGSHKKREFSKSLPPNQESTTVDDWSVTSYSTMSNSVSDKYTSDDHGCAGRSDDADATSRGATFHKVRLLELQLQQRDTTISQLRLAMEASEKSQSERVDSLERQVDRLVELSSGNFALIQAAAASEGARSERVCSLERRLGRLVGPPSRDCVARRDRGVPPPPIDSADEEERRGAVEDPDSAGAGIEIPALRELLAQVVAKKDGMASEHESLKWMSYSSASNDGVNMPSSIEELDSMIIDLDPIDDCEQDQHLESNDEWCQEQGPSDDYHHIHQESNEVIGQEHQTKRGRDIDSRRQDRDHSNGELDERCQGQYSSDDCRHIIQQDSNENESSPRASSEEQCSVLYKMSCRNCPPDRFDADYVGRLSTGVNNTTEALTEIVSHHFSQVWEMVQEQQDDVSVSLDIQNGGVDNGSFPSSSLARSLATDHCRHFSREEEILQWCAKNIKVEISEEDDDSISSPEIKKRRRKKHKKRREHRGEKHKKRRENRREHIISP